MINQFFGSLLRGSAHLRGAVWIVLAGSGFFAMAAQAQTAAANLPVCVAGPPNSSNGVCLRELFEQADGWKQTRTVTNELLYADWAFKQFGDADLHGWFGQMRGWNMKLELEVGAVKEWGGQTGRSTFDIERPQWDRLRRLGGAMASIAMDEPLCCVRERIKRPDVYAIQETANFIALVRHTYPDMMVGDIEPYPSISLADHKRWINALEERLAGMNVKGLDFYRLDVNWIVFDVRNEGSWQEVKQIEDYCHRIHLPFSLIYWTAGYDLYRHLKIADDSTWYVGVMSQGYGYAAIGGKPDQYVIESWVGAPAHSVPEAGDFTFTRTVLDFARKFIRQPSN